MHQNPYKRQHNIQTQIRKRHIPTPIIQKIHSPEKPMQRNMVNPFKTTRYQHKRGTRTNQKGKKRETQKTVPTKQKQKRREYNRNLHRWFT